MRASDLPKDERGNWFRSNPEARKFTETWMEMAADGKTDFTFTRFFREVLRDVYDYPWRDRQSAGRWLRRAYGDTYLRAMAPRRTRY